MGLKEEYVLKIFRSFVALAKTYGYFRPTHKMVFLVKKDLRVWIHENIFSTAPMMPLVGGGEGEKNFVIAFLAMVQTCLEGWEKTTNIFTID